MERKPRMGCSKGNPPYDVISEKEQNREVEAEKRYYGIDPIYLAAVGSKLNYYRLFIAKAISLLQKTECMDSLSHWR